MFHQKKENQKRKNSNGAICIGGICNTSYINACSGSFTIEMALVFPLVMLCFCVAIHTGIALHEEIKQKIEVYEEKRMLDAIACMYRKEYLEGIMGDLYGN